MRDNLTEIACVIDRSGSMQTIAADAIGGFNTFLASQQQQPGAARLTLVLFDHEYLAPYQSAPIDQIHPLDATTYVPRGMTALLDAIGRTIDELGVRLSNTPESDRPSKVIVAILTDGFENASRTYTRERVAGMIRHQQEKYAWEFVFLAANQDAITTAAQLSIPAKDTMSFVASPVGVREVYDALNTEVARRRSKG